MHTLQVFKCTFNVLINEDYFIRFDIDRYQSVLEHAFPKLDFSIGAGFYMFPSNFELSKVKTSGYNRQTLIINTDMKLT